MPSVSPQQIRLQQPQRHYQAQGYNYLPPKGQHQRRQVVGLGQVADENTGGRKDDRTEKGGRVAARELGLDEGWIGHGLILGKNRPLV